VGSAVADDAFHSLETSRSPRNRAERWSDGHLLILSCAMNKTVSEKRYSEERPASTDNERKETPFEAVASICSVLVVGLFILTFLAQNMVIPSGSMKNTLLVGDHLLVDRITLSPSASWMPLMRYREPRRGDIVVFFKPVYQPGIDATDPDGTPQYTRLVKRLIGVPGDHIHLRNGIVIVNGVAQPVGTAQPTTDNFNEFLDDFPAVSPAEASGATESWAVTFASHVQDGDLVVPPGMYFMMGDNRHNSLDSRFWGFVPSANIIGRPLLNYWSFEATGGEYEKTGISQQLAWMGHVALHFFSDTRWKRTLQVKR
jgi:signal peptidase I